MKGKRRHSAVTGDDIERMNSRIGAYAGYDGPDLADGIDRFESLQQPDVTTDDPLARFVIARIIERELEPRGEVIAVYDEIGGPIAHRYATRGREDCVTFRRIVALYVDELAAADQAVEEDPTKGPFYVRAGALCAAVQVIAQQWSGHRDFDPSWA